MTTITFRVDGTPRGQPRPRAFSRGGHARVYDAASAEGWKSCVALAVRPHLPPAPFTGRVGVTIVFLFQRPKSHFGARGLKPSAPRDHTGKPDLDNLAKAVLDALTELRMWRDDAQVAPLNLDKRWCLDPDADHPGAFVTLTISGGAP